MPKTRRKITAKYRFHLSHRLSLIAFFVALIAIIPTVNIHAATLSSASLSLSDPRPSNFSTGYTFTGSSVSLSAIRCIKWVFADTATGTNVPAGMITNGTVSTDTANTNYVPTPAAWTLNKPANGTLTLTNAGGETPASAAARKVAINGITNPSTPNTAYYLRMNTYSNVDCATGPIDAGTVSFVTSFGSTLSLTVDPSLSFSVNAVNAGQSCNGATSTQTSTATTLAFGTVSSAANGVVCQDLTAATNATNGYTIYTRYSGQPANALSQTIANVSGSNATPAAFPAAGNEAYGYTTNDATLGTGTAGRFVSNQWAAMTTSNAEVAFEAAGVSGGTYRVGHQVGVSAITRPGTYQTTVIYTCTPIY